MTYDQQDKGVVDEETEDQLDKEFLEEVYGKSG